MQARLAQEIAQQLRTHIIASGMEVGAKLPTESELMAQYGVSRSTIREAVKILQAENVILIRRGLGSFVADNTGIASDPLGLSFADQTRLLPEMMEVRLLLEPDLAALAAQRRTEDDLACMRRALAQMEAAMKAGEDYHTYDYQFHIAMAQCVHNSVIERIFPVIFEAVESGYAKTSHVQGSYTVALDFHKQILSAVKAGQSEAAMQATRCHIQRTLRDINEQLSPKQPKGEQT